MTSLALPEGKTPRRYSRSNGNRYVEGWICPCKRYMTAVGSSYYLSRGISHQCDAGHLWHHDGRGKWETR